MRHTSCFNCGQPGTVKRNSWVCDACNALFPDDCAECGEPHDRTADAGTMCEGCIEDTFEASRDDEWDEREGNPEADCVSDDWRTDPF